LEVVLAKQLSLFDNPEFYESVDVEFKSAKGGLPQSLWETYSAFANTNGGTIFLGIGEKDSGRLDIHGVETPDKFIQDIRNTANNKGKVSTNLLGLDDADVFKVGGKDIVRIRVRRANRYERPVYLNGAPFSSTYRRDHAGDFKCTDEEVRRMFADQSSEPADSRILEGFTLEDLHPISLQQYRNRVGATNPTHPWLLEDDLGLLIKLGGWRRDRIKKDEGLTVAGLLMFGREGAIRDPAAFPQFQLDYRERLSEEPQQRWSDRVTLDGTWEGNLFQFYNRVLPRLTATFKNPFQLDSNLYRYDETSVGAALREAIVNALIHADYSGQGGIVVDRYPDRIELSNPGTLLLSHEQLLKGGISECRNKSLQAMFQLMGAGDKAGSGLDKIRASWADAKFRAPSLLETQKPDRVVLALPMVSLLSDATLAELRSRFGGRVEELRPEEVQILAMSLEKDGVTNIDLQSVLTVHRSDLTRMLQQLVRAGFLERSGFGRWTRYKVLVPVARQAKGEVRSGFVSDGRLSANDGGSSPGDGGFAPSDGGFLSSDGGYPSDGSDNSGPDGLLKDRDPLLWTRLLRLSEQARASQRASAEELRAAILRLCEAAGWLTRDELGTLLHRSGSNLRDRYLNPMVSEGLLLLRYEPASHPYQAYGTPAQDNSQQEATRI
jgi:ATP-dependent DNA helicase RecG